MQFIIFKMLFPKSTIEVLFATKTNSVILKTYNQSNIEQFIVPEEIPDIDLLGILKVMCKVVGGQQVGNLTPDIKTAQLSELQSKHRLGNQFRLCRCC